MEWRFSCQFKYVSGRPCCKAGFWREVDCTGLGGGEGRGESWPAASYRSVVQLSSSRQHIKMKSLPKTLFSGSENINENDKKKLFVNNFSDNMETVLGYFAWDGKATGIIGLTLSNDNRRVESARFYTRGTLQERSIKVAASEIWENAHESVTLTIKLPRAEVFSLYSQYVDEEAVTYYMHSTVEDRPPVPISAQEKKSGKSASSVSGRCATSPNPPQHEAG